MKTRVWYHKPETGEKVMMDYEEGQFVHIPRIDEIVDMVECMEHEDVFIGGTVEDVHYTTIKCRRTKERKMVVSVFIE